MLIRISLQAGATTEATGLDFISGSVTVLVGPNNSRKSLVLREIELLIREGGVTVPDRYKVVTSIAARDLDPVEIEALVQARHSEPLAGSPPRPLRDTDSCDAAIPPACPARLRNYKSTILLPRRLAELRNHRECLHISWPCTW